jgi:hypothetical protein
MCILLVTAINGTICPVGIEVNGPNCTTNCDVFEFTYPSTIGEAFSIFIQTTIARSQAFIISHKTMLLIGNPRRNIGAQLQVFARKHDIEVS